jgi:outer membrane receptor protein involved in Fe transport
MRCFVAGIILLLALTAPSLAFAQAGPPGQMPLNTAPGKLSGTVTGPDGQPLASVGITVKSATDSSMVTAVITQKDGKFRIDGLPFGKYTLRVAMIGYKPRSSDVFALTPEKTSIEVGAIKLEVAPVQLNAVEAVAEKSPVVVEADKTTYNAKTNPVAATGTTADVLRTVPELEVDVDGNVKLRGNQSVAIQINGKPAPMRGEQLARFLQQLPGNRVDKVEVIQNPSAKQDPDGSAGGIVNIVLKADLDLGLSGSLNASTSTRNQQNFGGRLNYQHGRLTLFAGGNHGLYEYQQTNRDFARTSSRAPTSILQTGDANNDNNSSFGDLTAELKVGKQATLSTFSYWNMWGGGNSTLTTYDIMNDASVTMDRYTRDTDNENAYKGLTANLGFKQIFVRSKHELTIDGMVSRNGGDNENTSTKVFLMSGGAAVTLPDELTLNVVDDESKNLRFSLDYIRPLDKLNLNMGFGAQRRLQEYDNDLRVFADPDAVTQTGGTHTLYNFDEVYRWVYFTASQTIGKFGLQAGLRAELATSEFELPLDDQLLDNDYNSVFPNVNLSYTVKPGRMIRVGYRKTIGRPSPYVLNPYVPSTDPLNRYIGNPNIRPNYTHNFTSNMSWSGQKLTLTLGPYYRRTVDAWDRIRTVDSVGVSTMRYENVATVENYGSNFSLSVRPTGKLSGSVNFGVFRDVRDGSNIGSQYKSSAWRWSMGGYGSFRFNKTLTASANANYMAP